MDELPGVVLFPRREPESGNDDRGSPENLTDTSDLGLEEQPELRTVREPQLCGL